MSNEKCPFSFSFFLFSFFMIFLVLLLLSCPTNEDYHPCFRYEGLPTRLVVDGKEEPEFMKDLAEYSFTKVLDTDRQKTISDYYSPA